MVGFIVDEFGSRPAGTQVELQTARFLAEQYRAMGYAVEITPFAFSGRTGSGTSQNVIAWHPNEDPEAPLIILGGHYDTVPAGPGANDNGSGTATVLEVARELSARPIDRVAIWYVAFGAEELGLFGSRNLVDTLSSRDRGRLRLMVSIDMMAVGEQPAFHGSDPWVSEAMARAWSQGYEPVRLPASFRRLSDHGPFLEAGLPAIMFHWVEDFCWHQSCDVAERVQYEALELMGAIAIDLVRLVAVG
jgi:Zn-dependent M28 family amino/carboxypeptidase